MPAFCWQLLLNRSFSVRRFVIDCRSRYTHLTFIGNTAQAWFAGDSIFGDWQLEIFFRLRLGQFTHALAELFDAFADGGPHLRQLFGAKDKQRDKKNDDQVKAVES